MLNTYIQEVIKYSPVYIMVQGVNFGPPIFFGGLLHVLYGRGVQCGLNYEFTNTALGLVFN